MNVFDKVDKQHEEQGYSPSYLSWAKSYEAEIAEMRELILGEPADVRLLKQEYECLTGKRFRRTKDWT